MAENYPINPSPELIEQWYEKADNPLEDAVQGVATRAARRPEPPSLKAQALERLAWIDEKLEAPLLNHCDAIHTIRRALEQLNDYND